jgi:hypothetical protein
MVVNSKPRILGGNQEGCTYISINIIPRSGPKMEQMWKLWIEVLSARLCRSNTVIKRTTPSHPTEHPRSSSPTKYPIIKAKRLSIRSSKKCPKFQNNLSRSLLAGCWSNYPWKEDGRIHNGELIYLCQQDGRRSTMNPRSSFLYMGMKHNLHE